MAKKSFATVLIENVDLLEKQLTLTLPSIVNVSRLASIFNVQSPESSGPFSAVPLHEPEVLGQNFTSIYSQLIQADDQAELRQGSKNETVSGSILEDATSVYCDTLQVTAQCLGICLFLWLVNRALWKSSLLEFLPKFIASWAFVLVTAPLGVLFAVVCLGGRLLTGIYLRIRFKERIFLAHPMDSAWAYESKASPSTCTGLYVVRGKCDYEKILRRMEHCMEVEMTDGKLMFDRMRYALRNVFGYVCWERMEDFEMHRHVKLISDRNPDLRDCAMDESQLFEELGRIHDEVLPERGLPPWEILVVPRFIYNGNDPESHYALVFRIHHAVMDGVSTGNALHSGIADRPFKFTVDPVAPLKVSKFQHWLAYFLAVWMVPLVTIKNLSLNERHAFHGEQLRGPKNFAWSRAVRLKALKALKTETNSSVFAILMAAIGGSMRRLFEEKGEQIPGVIHAAPPVAILPFPDRAPKNRFSIVIFPIQIGIADALERLRSVYRETQELAKSSDILANYYMMNWLGMLPLPVIKFLGKFAHATMTLSNIPGPAELVSVFEGDTLVDVGAWVPVKNTIGIGMALFSYADRLRVTIVADETCLPHKEDVQLLRDEFENQLAEIAARTAASTFVDPLNDQLFCEH